MGVAVDGNEREDIARSLGPESKVCHYSSLDMVCTVPFMLILVGADAA
jgi:hypothetical protein